MWQLQVYEANSSLYLQVHYPMVTLHNDAFKLLRGYSALLPPKAMNFPNHLPLADVHSFLVDSVLLGQNLPHLQAYPPSKIYQYAFWKWAICRLENMLTDEAR